MSKKHDVLYRLTLLGDPGVGKGKLVTCFFHQDRFKEPYFLTLRITSGAKRISLDDKLCALHFTAMPKAASHAPMLQIGSFDGIVFVFDITKRSSFDNLSYWLNEANKYALPSKNFESLLIGNKCDKEREREVAYGTAEEFALTLNIPYIETSAKDGTNVEIAFVMMAALVKKERDHTP